LLARRPRLEQAAPSHRRGHASGIKSIGLSGRCQLTPRPTKREAQPSKANQHHSPS
jgi:hypothetical protein